MFSPKLRGRWRRNKFSSRRKLAIGIALILLVFLGFQWRQFFAANARFVPASGGIFIEAMVGSSNNLNPLAPDVTVFDKDLQSLLFSGLLEYNPTTAQFESALGSFRVSEDGITYIVTLKNSAKFSNGDEVTVDDILFTYETVIKNPNFRNTTLAQRFEYITIERDGERAVRFTLPEPNAFFPFALTTPILSAKSYKGALLEEILDTSYPANKHPVGTGPFRLKNIIPEDDGSFRVFLQRNKHYFKQTPYVKQIVLYVYPTFDHLRFRHDWPTMFSQVPVNEQSDFQETLFGEYTLREYILPRYLGVFFNLDTKVAGNPYFRDALSFGINKAKLLENNDGWKQVDSLFFFEGVEAWHELDLAEARKILQSGGFPYNSELETRTHQQQPVDLKVITSVAPPVYSRMAQSIAQTWAKELDIKVDVAVLEPVEFDRALKTREYDIALFGTDFSENAHSLSAWHSSQTGKLNLANLTNTDIDFAINEISLTGDKGELFQLGQKLNDLIPAVPLATPQYYLFVSNNLRGFSDNFGKLRHHSDRFYGIENWYFEEKRIWDLQGRSKIGGFLAFLFS